jgi:hypothetical protein
MFMSGALAQGMSWRGHVRPVTDCLPEPHAATSLGEQPHCGYAQGSTAGWRREHQPSSHKQGPPARFPMRHSCVLVRRLWPPPLLGTGTQWAHGHGHGHGHGVFILATSSAPVHSAPHWWGGLPPIVSVYPPTLGTRKDTSPLRT